MKKVLSMLVFCLLIPLWSQAATVSQGELEAAVQKLLQERPDLVLEVLRRNSEQVLEIAQEGANLRRKHNLEAQWQEDQKKPKKVRLEERPVLGNPDARVKVVAFSDFSCHYCAQAAKNVEELRKEYGDDVAFVFKHLPLDEKGPGGVASAYFVAIALQSEPKAWEFYKAMYDNRDQLLAEGEPFIKKTAQGLGLDMKKLQKDLQGKRVREILAQDQEDGQKLGVEGTPYFLVNNLVVRGAIPLDLFRSAVEMAKKG
ncbi:MAG: thioredoxin domain-containing protein [Desulfovibrio sp.]|nr:thioredoxin domain-containing protein [Desulfovibrio sp.]